MLQDGSDNLLEHGVTQLLLALGEVMEERALGCAGMRNYAVEAAALKAMAIELGEGGLEDLATGGFRRFQFGDFRGGFLHHATTIQTSRYVCQETNKILFFTGVNR